MTQEDQPKRAAGYVRVSSKGQVDDHESLSTQRQSIEDYCNKNDLKLTEIYADEGISGRTTKERLGLLRCLRDAKQSKFDVLIIHRLSRFGRGALDFMK